MAEDEFEKKKDILQGKVICAGCCALKPKCECDYNLQFWVVNEDNVRDIIKSLAIEREEVEELREKLKKHRQKYFCKSCNGELIQHAEEVVHWYAIEEVFDSLLNPKKEEKE